METDSRKRLSETRTRETEEEEEEDDEEDDEDEEASFPWKLQKQQAFHGSC
jgi:hypothetical protein